MRSGLFYAYFTHFSVGYALGGLSDVLGGVGGVVCDFGRNREKKTKLGRAETGWRPQGGSGIYGEEELDESSTEMKPFGVGLDSCPGYGQVSSA